MTPLAAAVLSGAVAASLGPAAVAVARREVHSAWRPCAVETTAIVAMAGLVGAQAALSSRVLLGPLAVLGAVAALVDAYEARLPDHLTGPTLLATTGLCLLTVGPAPLLVAIVFGAVLILVKWVSPEAIGWGDVKLAPSVVIVLVSGATSAVGPVLVLGLIAATACVFARDRMSTVPYGPALVIGGVFAPT